MLLTIWLLAGMTALSREYVRFLNLAPTHSHTTISLPAAVENGPGRRWFMALKQSIVMRFIKYLASTLRTGFRVLVPTCRQVSRLQSDTLDRELPSPKRFGLRLHLLICKWCRRYGRQVRFLHHAAHEHSEDLTEVTPRGLSAEARQRLKRSLRDETK